MSVRVAPHRKYKRNLDLFILITAHIILFPLWILLWTLIPLLIWLGDRGPIFFSQRRTGKLGQEFTILKFRTMTPNAEVNGLVWTIDGDPRITFVGKFLRRTALDELPELISVWKGDMSFVGPRALDCREQHKLELEIPGFERRLEVTPGLTGMAQIYDQHDLASEKIRYDLEYIDRMSLKLDIVLLLLSMKNTLLAKWDQRGGKTLT